LKNIQLLEVTEIASQYVPCLVPQDYGNKSDVRWLTITNEEDIVFFPKNINFKLNLLLLILKKHLLKKFGKRNIQIKNLTWEKVQIYDSAT
jgi:hypothetical protein